jgi:hypothetical protein
MKKKFIVSLILIGLMLLAVMMMGSKCNGVPDTYTYSEAAGADKIREAAGNELNDMNDASAVSTPIYSTNMTQTEQQGCAISLPICLQKSSMR